jgi:hypothetical protein
MATSSTPKKPSPAPRKPLITDRRPEPAPAPIAPAIPAEEPIPAAKVARIETIGDMVDAVRQLGG